MKPSDFIYVFHNKSTGLTKIGITYNPKRRKRSLVNSNGVGLIRLHCGIVGSDLAMKIEKEVKLKFSSFRREGEWFDLNDRQILDMIQFIKNYKS